MLILVILPSVVLEILIGDSKSRSSPEIEGEVKWYFIIGYFIILDVTLGISIDFVHYNIIYLPSILYIYNIIIFDKFSQCAHKYNKVTDDKVPIFSLFNFGRSTRLGIARFGRRMQLTIMHHPVH